MSLMATPMPVGSSASTSSAPAASSSAGSTPGNNNLPFEKDKIWYFTNEQLASSPSRRCGIKPDDELQYRQMTAYLIQEMGQRLQVSQLCINTAIVYMHRFYAFHSFTHFHRNSMASASLFLAAKVEEQPRKLEHVIRAANKCLPPTTEQNYADLAQELVFNENVLLQTLGFDVAIDHPHTHVVRTCQLVKACKDLAQTSYFLASNSLHLTSMCLQYRPTVVACFCIYLACKWSRWEIPQSTEGKHWFYYVDKSVSMELLKQLTEEFIEIYEKSPARLKSKLNSIRAIAQGASNRTAANSKDNKPKEEWKIGEMIKGYHSNIELVNGNDSRERDRDRDRDVEREQRVPKALLPPPAMVPQQRRTEGSHQRSSSVSGGPSKMLNYAPEAHPDHKSKQPGYNNRIPSSHQRSASCSTNQRSSSSSSSSSASSSQPQPGRTSGPSMDYHKSSRNLPPVGIPPLGGHKMPTNPKPTSQQPPNTHPSASNSSSSSSSSSAGKDKSQSSKMYPNAPLPTHPLMSRGGYALSGSNGAPPPANNPTPTQNPTGYAGHRSKSGSGSSVHSLPPFEQQLPYAQSQGYNSNHLQQPQLEAPNPPPPPPPTTTTSAAAKNNSLFSPEWSDIKKEPPFNGLLPPPPDYKLNNHPRDKESPKKERLTPTKKDKHRPTMPTLSGTTKSIMPPPKKELLPNPNESNNLKRANDLSASQYGLNKLDDLDGSGASREKLRKLDNSSGLPGYPSFEEVRNLLKESLCPTNASLLKPEALTMPGLMPPAELLAEPTPTPAPPVAIIKKEPNTLPAPMELDTPQLTKLPPVNDIKQEQDLTSSSKSEKKKKKDKHKHKEKDKSKDKTEKEERKKHKKDKQKDRSSSSSKDDSLKLVIKTNTASSAPNPNGNAATAAAPLKLKISMNKLEPNNYPPGYTQPAAAAPATSANPHTSSKKKHSDRDRDKESKKSSSKTQDYSKYNGAAGGKVGGGPGGGVFNPLGGAGAAPNAVSSVPATNAPALAQPPAALPIYNKK